MAPCRLPVPTPATRRSETSCTDRLEGGSTRVKSRLGVWFALARYSKVLKKTAAG